MRYKLRTLLILLAVLPPLLWIGWTKYQDWKVEQVRQRALAAEQRTLKSGSFIFTDSAYGLDLQRRTCGS